MPAGQHVYVEITITLMWRTDKVAVYFFHCLVVVYVVIQDTTFSGLSLKFHFVEKNSFL